MLPHSQRRYDIHDSVNGEDIPVSIGITHEEADRYAQAESDHAAIASLEAGCTIALFSNFSVQRTK